jgi:hypothetical protein
MIRPTLLILTCILYLNVTAQEKYKVIQSTTQFRDLQTKEWGKMTTSKSTDSYILYDKSSLTITIGSSESENIFQIIENYFSTANAVFNVKAVQNLHDDNSSINEYLVIKCLKVETLYKVFVNRFVKVFGLTDNKYIEDLHLTFTCTK